MLAGRTAEAREVCVLTSEPSHLDLNLNPAINCYPGVSDVERGTSVCVILGWTLSCVSHVLALVDVKDPTVSFAQNIRELSPATLNKLQIPAHSVEYSALESQPVEDCNSCQINYFGRTDALCGTHE